MNAILEFLGGHAGILLDGWLTMQVQTGIFVLVVLAVDMSVRNASPRFRYLLWMTALFKAVIPPVLFVPASAPSAAGALFTLPGITVGEAVTGTVAGPMSLSAAALALVLLSSIAFAFFVLQRTLRLRMLLGDARPLQHDAWESDPMVYVSSRIPSPLAFGIFRPRIFISNDIAVSPREVLHAVLHHEHAHIERRDGAVVFLQTLVQIFYVLNPLVWLMNIRLFRYREQICDEAALRRTGTRPVEYGRLLLRYAEAQPARIVQVGTCFFETRHGFVDRVTQLFSPAQSRRLKRLHRVAIGLLILCIVPLSWKCSEEGEADLLLPVKHEASIPTEAAGKDPGDSKAAEIVGGLDALRERIIYPEEAAEESLEGMVIINVDVKADGRTGSMEVLRSAHPLLDAAALKAVEGLTFSPALEKGVAISSEISIPIRYRLK